MSRLDDVLLITGTVGSGKSTLARHVAERSGWGSMSEDAYWVLHGWSGIRTEEQERIVLRCAVLCRERGVAHNLL
jgi:adenylate kinase family enzyme